MIDPKGAALIGVQPYERTRDRTTSRSGLRPRLLTSQAGGRDLRTPKLRQGSFFSPLLERRRRLDPGSYAVVMEAYVYGVWKRKANDLVNALGADSGISKSEVSRICSDLDGDAQAFRQRALSETAYPLRVFCRHTLQSPGWRVDSVPSRFVCLEVSRSPTPGNTRC